ncbi:MAG TPA: SDR family oxidoreductase [Thermoanaerobaculia bacterium]|jgi:3-oxoacyl-[acyl-carrier protein] reductase|nr:SDR family oxidoreductase [Thermoanaerobaculia bacterium]
MIRDSTFDIRHSAILVTGGSRGLGRAIVEALAGESRRVAFTFRREEATARELAARLEAERGVAVRAFPFDLADRERPDDLIAEVEAAVGPLGGLVNNAGIRRESLLALTSDEDWDAVLDQNLSGAFRLARAVLRGFVSRRRGAIVNVSSLSALHGVAGQAAYAATKAGLLAMTRVLAREVGKRNVRVNAVIPGFVATDLTAGLSPEQIGRLRSGECLPGGVSAESVAAAVAFLLGEGAASITGQTLVVDAGASA